MSTRTSTYYANLAYFKERLERDAVRPPRASFKWPTRAILARAGKAGTRGLVAKQAVTRLLRRLEGGRGDGR